MVRHTDFRGEKGGSGTKSTATHAVMVRAVADWVVGTGCHAWGRGTGPGRLLLVHS